MTLADDPDVIEPLKFLREREVVHFQRFGEALRIVDDYLSSQKQFNIKMPENMRSNEGLMDTRMMKPNDKVMDTRMMKPNDNLLDTKIKDLKMNDTKMPESMYDMKMRDMKLRDMRMHE